MPVIALQSGNVGLVGKVIEVGHYTSLVMPIYDFQCSVSARIQNTRDLGLVSGMVLKAKIFQDILAKECLMNYISAM